MESETLYFTINEMALPSTADGGGGYWTRFVKPGRYPVKLKGGREIIQVVDNESMNAMVAYFNSPERLRDYPKGIPIYEGHADDPTWLASHPGYKAAALGRITKMEVRNNELWTYRLFNETGLNLVTGPAPAYAQHSARWLMIPFGSSNEFRPVQLISDALTDSPNIPESVLGINEERRTNNLKTDHMKLTPKIHKWLKTTPETPEDDVHAKLEAKADNEMDADTGTAENERQVTALNIRLTETETDRNKYRDALIDTHLTTAINDGRITPALKDRWKTALETSFDTEVVKLTSLMPVINTRNKTGIDPATTKPIPGQTIVVANISERKMQVIEAYMKENKMGPSDYGAASHACAAKFPELFATGSSTKA